VKDILTENTDLGKRRKTGKRRELSYEMLVEAFEKNKESSAWRGVKTSTQEKGDFELEPLVAPRRS